MRKLLLALLAPFALSGCVGEPIWSGPEMPQAVAYDNPILVPSPDAQYVFATVADVVGDYFKIDHEEPVRLLGAMLTEGRIDTFPKVGATIFEPWDHDSADNYERVESTLQSIRRIARVRVVPSREGFWVEVVVFKELENLLQPEYATAGRGDLPSRHHADPRHRSHADPGPAYQLASPRPRPRVGTANRRPIAYRFDMR